MGAQGSVVEVVVVTLYPHGHYQLTAYSYEPDYTHYMLSFYLPD